MQNEILWHDRRALSLIDACLRDGTFTAKAVAEISGALAQAERSEREQHPHVRRAPRR
jgi:hypothetical protein